MTVVAFPIGGPDDGHVYVETAGEVPDGQDEPGLSRAGAGERVARTAMHTWEQALDGVRAAAAGALRQLNRIEPTPDEIKVSFGVAVNGKLGAAVVAAGADANLKVEVTWKALPNQT